MNNTFIRKRNQAGLITFRYDFILLKRVEKNYLALFSEIILNNKSS